MFTEYDQLVAYFEALPTSISELASVTVGNDEALLDLQNTRIKYAHLWVETPSVRFVGDDVNPAKRFNLAIAVIINSPKKSNPEANKRLSRMMKVLEKVYAQIVQDAEDGLFDLVLKDEETEPIREWSNDNCFGWRLEQISIELPRCLCDCDE